MVIEREYDWYVAKYVEIGTASQGKTVEEALRNITEAIELYLECLKEDKATELRTDLNNNL